MKNQPATILLLYNLIVFGYVFSRGFYSFSGVLIIALVTILFGLYIANRIRSTVSPSGFDLFIRVSVLSSVFLSLILYGGLYQKFEFLVMSSKILLFIALFLVLLYFIKLPLVKIVAKAKFILLVLIAITLKIFMIISSPSPLIDVFIVLKEGPLAFYHNLANPYAMRFTPLYPGIEPNSFGYFPLTIYLSLIPDILFSDPRVGLLAAEMVLAYLILKIVNSKETGHLIALLVLYHPLSLFILEQSWVDIYFVCLFTVLIFLIKKKANHYLQGFILGLALSIKQTFIFLPVFFLRAGFLRLRHIVGMLVAFILVILPFFLWSPPDFVSDTVFHFFDPSRDAAPIRSSLNLNSFFWQNFGYEIPIYLKAIFVLAVFIFTLFMQKRTAFSLTVNFAFFLLSVFFFGSRAFANYYYSVSMLLLVALSIQFGRSLDN